GQATGYFGDTWTYGADAGWTGVCGTGDGGTGDSGTGCACGPCPRAYHAMAYDAARSQIVMFGGRNANGPSQDTWAFGANQQWTTLCSGTCTPPSARSEHAMAFDPVRKVIVMFGGKDSGGKLLGDTWEWDGMQWHAMSPSSQLPPARSGHAMA